MTAMGFTVLDNVVVVEMPTENNMAIGDTENRELSRRPAQRQKRCCVRADELTEKCRRQKRCCGRADKVTEKCGGGGHDCA